MSVQPSAIESALPSIGEATWRDTSCWGAAGDASAGRSTAYRSAMSDYWEGEGRGLPSEHGSHSSAGKRHAQLASASSLSR